MEMILPDTNELYMSIDSYSQQLTQLLRQKIQTKKQALEHLKLSYEQHSVEKKLEQKRDEIRQLREAFTQSIDFKLSSTQKELQNIKERFPHTIDSTLNLAQNQLLHLRKMLESNHPKLKTKKGFAQISRSGVVINIDSLEKDDVFEAQSDSVIVEAKVLEKRKI